MSSTETMVKPSRKHLRGFASLSPERRSEIARMGGASVPANRRSFSQNRELAASAGAMGGRRSAGGAFRTGALTERTLDALRFGPLSKADLVERFHAPVNSIVSTLFWLSRHGYVVNRNPKRGRGAIALYDITEAGFAAISAHIVRKAA